LLIKFVFDVLLRGFAPFIISRPWAVKSLVEETLKEKIHENPVIYSLSCGKSGYLSAIGEVFPAAELIGVEHDIMPYYLEKIQLFFKRSRIKTFFHKHLYNLDVSRADLIYCYLDVEILRDLPKKLKFECKPGTIIISNGYPIPGLFEKRMVEIESQERRMGFLSKRKKMFKSKSKEGNRANLFYVYEI
jgi:hypothetical protein